MRNKIIRAERRRSDAILKFKLATQLKRLRKDNNITQVELSKLCGLASSRVGQCENSFDRVSSKMLNIILEKLKEILKERE